MARTAVLAFTLIAFAAMVGLAPPTTISTQPAAGTIDDTLIVMTFNIRFGTANDGDNAWPKRRQLVIDRIHESKADIVGLQEALRFQIDELLAAMPEYAFTGVGRDDGRSAGEHSAILYRQAKFKLKAPVGSASPSSGDFWYSDTPAVPGSKSWGNNITRVCSWARFERTDAPQAFYVFNTHLDHESQPSRERSARLLKQRIANRIGNDPVLVTGDFNAGESNPAIVEMLKVDVASKETPVPCPRLQDSFRVKHADTSAVGTFNRFKGMPSHTADKIDYIFIDDRWDVLDASIDRTMPDGRCPSDHFPVTAKLRVKPVEPAHTNP